MAFHSGWSPQVGKNQAGSTCPSPRARLWAQGGSRSPIRSLPLLLMLGCWHRSGLAPPLCRLRCLIPAWLVSHSLCVHQPHPAKPASLSARAVIPTMLRVPFCTLGVPRRTPTLLSNWCQPQQSSGEGGRIC